MNPASPYFRSFLICGLWQIAVGIRGLARQNGDWSAFPEWYFMTLGFTWVISSLLVGLAAARVQKLRPWLPVSVASVASTFIVIGAMVAITSVLRPGKRTPKFRSADEKMVYFAKEAAGWVKADRSLDLSYTFDSIQVIETQLARLSGGINRTNPPPGTYGQAIGYGAYIGEVFRRRNGGSWAEDHPSGGPKSFPFTQSNLTIFPIAWCWRRVINGAEDNVYHKALLFESAGKDLTNAVPLTPQR